MSNNKKENFRVERNKSNIWEQMYADDPSLQRLKDRTVSYRSQNLASAAAVREALSNAITNRQSLVDTSRKLYATNPVYASIIDYLSNMFLWRYKVTPHKVYTKSKAKSKKEIKEEDFSLIYSAMLEIVDGLSIPTIFPSLIANMLLNGAVYFTTMLDEELMTINTIILPDQYCRKVAMTKYNTAIIEFDFSYFQNLGLTKEELDETLLMFPEEFGTLYSEYLKDANKRWQILTPSTATGILLNEVSVPTSVYVLGSILNFEEYQDNELERNENLLKYIVAHTMPHYNDQLLFDMDEVKGLHKSLKKIVETNDKVRLITTYGEVEVLKVSENDTAENQVLSKAFKSIFNNAGLNDVIFTGDSVTALELSLIRDKTRIWNYIQALVNFYNITVNNWFDFKNYQADFEILQISLYTYNDDMEVYKNNATLGVGKLDYMIASGIKQKNIADQLYLESFLGLDKIQPMKTSYTQTDNAATDTSSSEIEPSGKDNQAENGKSKQDNEEVKTNEKEN